MTRLLVRTGALMPLIDLGNCRHRQSPSRFTPRVPLREVKSDTDNPGADRGATIESVGCPLNRDEGGLHDVIEVPPIDTPGASQDPVNPIAVTLE